MTFLCRLQDGVLGIHWEEDHEPDTYTNCLVRIKIGDQEILCYLYPKLLPGIGFVLSADFCLNDDYLPALTEEYLNEHSKRAGLSNILGNMFLVNRMLPADEQLSTERIVELLKGTLDATMFTGVFRENGQVQTEGFIISDSTELSSNGITPRPLGPKPGNFNYTVGMYPYEQFPKKNLKNTRSLRRAIRKSDRPQIFRRPRSFQRTIGKELRKHGFRYAREINEIVGQGDKSLPVLLNSILKRTHRLDDHLAVEAPQWLCNHIARRSAVVYVMTSEVSYAVIFPQGDLPRSVTAEQLKPLAPMIGRDGKTMHVFHVDMRPSITKGNAD